VTMVASQQLLATGTARESQSLLETTGSFSGFRSQIQQIGSGYLSAESSRKHRLCGNKEGWGPLSPHRYDFTPCFLDVWVSTVAVYGILFGAVAIWWLIQRKNKAIVPRNWHFWTKQVWKYSTAFVCFQTRG
jgi:ATP-binding cassette, subfamily C (CFTR/MRP), member 1